MQLHAPYYIILYRKQQHNVLKWSKNTPHKDRLHSSRGQTSVVPRTKAKVPGTLGPVLGTTKMGYFLDKMGYFLEM